MNYSQSHTLVYAGIGSRETPEPVLTLMRRCAIRLRELGYTLRSGGCTGADTAFELGAGDNRHIYLPWNGYNNHYTSDHCCTDIVSAASLELAAKFHPAWERCTQGARKLHARNCNIILGLNLNKPVDFVLCWHQNSGGTMQGVRIAEHYHIPVINLADPNWKSKLQALVYDKSTNTEEQSGEEPDCSSKGGDVEQKLEQELEKFNNSDIRKRISNIPYTLKDILHYDNECFQVECTNDTGLPAAYTHYYATDKHSSEKSLECSSKGDKRFSAMYAQVDIPGLGKMSIEAHYQSVKFDANNKPVKKGKPVHHITLWKGNELPATYLTAWYRYLWYTYLKQNPELVKYASQFTNFTDMFRGKAINCQADCIKAFVQKDKDFYNCIIKFIKLTGLPIPAKKETK